MRVFLAFILIFSFQAYAGTRAPASASKPCARNRVILITDSHGLSPFGEFLEDWLLTMPDYEVNTYALGGSGPSWWFQSVTTPRGFIFNSCYPKTRLKRRTLAARAVPTPDLAATLRTNARAYEHQVVVVAFGTNVRGAVSSYVAQTKLFVRTIMKNPNTTCIWIAPPNMRKREAKYMNDVYEAIEAGIANAGKNNTNNTCQLIDSRKYANYPQAHGNPLQDGDGIHYPYTPEGIAASHLWVDGVVNELRPVFSSK